MIVAKYLNGITLMLPVYPVGRIERLAPQGGQSQRSGQEQSSFAALLDAMMRTSTKDESNGFDSRA